MDLQTKIREYAELLVDVGLNVQKGQTVLINASVENAEFARLCVERAYDRGAREVIVQWKDDFTAKQHYLRSEDAVFDECPQWHVDRYNDYASKNFGVLHIIGSDPELLKEVPPDRIQRRSRAYGLAMKDYSAKQMANEFAWCIGAVPVPAWAKKLFPELHEKEAVERLWEAILATVRVSGKGDSQKLWQEHIERTARRAQYLNDHNFQYLRYKNQLGTDFVVELPEDHIWTGGAEKTKAGIPFVANMPTEEIFTAPKRDSGNGVLVASKPLCIDGNVVENFRFVVKNGKIVELHAEKGEEVLKNAISLDEGASYFGELALVPFDSPISNMNLLFYDTLFDENASCHIAFGEAYPCVKGGENMTREELNQRGFNHSITHEDFMVGTRDLSIVGITHDGTEIPVFIGGNFAF